MYLVNSSLTEQETDFLRELHKSLFVDVYGCNWLIHANVDFGQVEVRVNHRLISNSRLELSLSITVHL